MSKTDRIEILAAADSLASKHDIEQKKHLKNEDAELTDPQLLFVISDKGALFSTVLSNTIDRYAPSGAINGYRRRPPSMSTQHIKARLGHNGRKKDVFTPVDIPAVAKIDVGDDHVMAVTVEGSVYAWGKNKAGCLGLGHARDCFVPTIVVTQAKIVDAAVGATHSIVLDSHGRVYTSGSAKNGRLGSMAKA